MKSISLPHNNSISKFFAFVCSFFFELSFRLVEAVRNLSNFHLISMKTASINSLTERKQRVPAIISTHLERMSLWVFMKCWVRMFLNVLSDACVPLLLGVLWPAPTRCQDKRLTSSLVTPRRGTTTPTSQLKSKFETEPSGVSSLPFADTSCWFPQVYACQ